MSGQAQGASSVADGAAPRRRKPNRPPTVALADFGKAPPPPPRIKLTPRQIATYSVVALVVILVVWFASVQIGQVADGYWSRAGNIDQRNR